MADFKARIEALLDTAKAESKLNTFVNEKRKVDVEVNFKLNQANQALHNLLKQMQNQGGNAGTQFSSQFVSAINSGMQEINTSQVINQIGKQSNRLTVNIRNNMRDLTKQTNTFNETTARTFGNQMTAWARNNGKAVKVYGSRINDLQAELSNAIDRGDGVAVKKIREDFRLLQSEARAAGNVGKTFSESFTSSLGKVAQFAASYVSIYRVFDELKQGVQTIVELDDALVDLQKTSTASLSRINEFYFEANDVAKKYGVTTKQIIQSAADWSRLGYNLADSKKMSALSSQFAAISPGVDVDTATTSLVSAMKAFGIETDDVLDGIMSKVNIVGNSFAVSNADVLEGLKRTSASMSAMGQDLDSTIALFTAANEVLQDAQVTGTALRTMSLRIRGFDEETEQLSEDLVGLNGKIIDLTKTASRPQGVSIWTDATKTQYKDFVDYFSELSSVWDEISPENQTALLNDLFGKRGAQAGSAIIKNFDTVTAALDKMSNSAGNADKEMGIIESSLTYKLNELKETGVGIFQNLFQREDIGVVVKALTSILEIIDTITEHLGLFKTAIIGFGAFKLFSNLGGITQFITKIGELSSISSIAGIGRISSIFTSIVASISPATLALSAFVAVAAGASLVIGHFNKKQEEQHKAAETAAESFAAERQSLEDYVKQIQTLREKLAEGSLSDAEAYEAKVQLLDIQNQLAETYGAEAAGLDLVTGAYESQIEAVQNLGKEKAKEFRNDNFDAIKKATKEIEEERKITIGNLTQNDELEKLINDEFSDRGVSYGRGKHGYSIEITGTAEEAEKVIDDLQARIIDVFGNGDIDKIPTFRQKGGFGDTLMQSLKKEKDAVSQVLSDYQGIYDQWQVAKAVLDEQEYESESGEKHSAIKWLNDYAEAVENYNKALKTGTEEDIAAARDRFNVLDNTLNYLTASSMSQYSDQVAEIRAELDEATIAERKFFNPDTDNKASKSLLQLKKDIKDLELTDLEFKDIFNFKKDDENFGFINEYINKALEYGVISDTSDSSLSSFAAKLVADGVLIASATEETNENVALLGEGISGFAEYQGKMTNALKKSSSAIGLGSEEISDLKEAYSNLDDFDASKLFEYTENGIRLNREELERLNSEIEENKLKELAQDYFDIKDAIAQAESKGEDTTGLENDLAQTKELIAQYRGLTSAYNAWLNAKEGGNAREGYQSIGQAYDSMKETLDSGWYDDPELNAYLDLMLSAEQRTGDAREDFAKLKQEIGDTGYSLMDFWQYNENGKLNSSGLKNMLDVINQFDDSIVSVGEDGAYSFDLTGENLQSVADYLGTSTEMVGFFLKALDDVGDIEFNTGDTDLDAFLNEFFGKEPPEVEVDIKAKEDALDGLRQQLKEYSEGGNVDLNVRPIVSSEKLTEAGYEAGEGNATVFTHTFSNEDETVAINFTPILPDGSVMEKNAFNQYCQEVVDGVREDTEGLQIGAPFYGEDAVQQAEQTAEEIHSIHQEMIDEFGGENVETIADIKVEADTSDAESKIEETTKPEEKQVKVDEVKGETISDTETESQTVEVNVKQTPDPLVINVEDAEVTIKPDKDEYTVSIADTTVTVTPDKESYTVSINDATVDVVPDKESYDVVINGQKVTVTPDKKGYNVKINDQSVTVTPNKESYDVTINGQTVTVTPTLDENAGELPVNITANPVDPTSAIADMQTTADGHPIKIKLIPVADTSNPLSNVEQLGNTLFGGQEFYVGNSSGTQQISATAVVDDVDSSGVGELTLPASVSVSETDSTSLGLENEILNVTFDTSGVEQGKQQVETAVNSLDGESASPKVQLDDQTQSTASTIKSEVSTIDGLSASPTVYINDYASGVLSSISSSMATLNGKTSTVTIITNKVTKVTTESSGSPANGTYRTTESNGTFSYANGTNVSITKDQNALVNELGNETLVRNGKAYVIPGGAQYIGLKRGDIIFNHKQTEQLQRYGIVTAGGGHGKLAYSDGTVNAYVTGKGIYFPDSNSSKNTNSNSNSGNNTSNSNSSSNKSNNKSKSNSSSNNKDDKKSQNTIDWIERRLKYFADAVKRIADSITDYVSSTVKRAKLIQQRSVIAKEIDANEKAYTTYMKYANNVKLSSALKRRVQIGVYSINDYDENTQKQINKYKEYYENAQKCVDTVAELKTTQLELFEDLMNIPTEVAEKKIDKLKSKFDTLSSSADAAALGLSGVSALMSMNNASISSAQKEYKNAKNNRNKASKRLTTAAKKLTRLDKRQKKNADGTFQLPRNSKSASYKRLKEYNTALKKNKSAQSAFNFANTNYQQLNNLYRLQGSGETYNYQNALIDAQTANLRQQNKANQEALRTSNANLANAQYDSTYARNVVTKRANVLSRVRNKTLATRAKAANGGKISVKGLSGTALKYAQAYNKLVDNARQKTNELKIAQEAQANAAQTAAQSQAELAQQIVQAEQEKFNNIKTYYEAQADYLDSISSKQQAANSLKETKGIMLSAQDYQNLINQNNTAVKNLNNEASKLQKQLDKSVKAGKIKKNSEEWKAMQSEIYGVQKAVLDLKNQTEEYNNAVAQLPFDKIQKQLEYLDSISDLLSSKQGLKTAQGFMLSADDYRQSMAENNKQIAQYQDAYNKAIANVKKANKNKNGVFGGKTVQEWQTEANGYLKSVTDMTKSNQELTNSIVNIPFETMEKELDYLKSQSEYNESLRSLTKERGNDLSEKDYQNKIAEAIEQQAKYERERLEAYNNYKKALKTGVYGGKSANEWLSEYNDFGKEINDIKIDIEKIRDDLRDDVYWRTFERAHQSCERLQNVLSGINNLIDDNSLFNKDGNLTEYGVSRIANLVKSFETAKKEVANYSNDIANLNKLYKAGYYTQEEYKEKLNELQKSVLDSAADMKSYQDNIIDMYKNLAQTELDALNKLIDKRADALNKKKEYYEYDKNIRKQTDELQMLQAQLAALEGINTLEATAKRRKLELEISEAQSELDETVQDHILDLSQDALNDLRDTLQDAFNDKWEDISGNLKEISTIMGEAKALTTTGFNAINSTLTTLLKHYGINVSSTGINAAFASGTTGVSHTLRALVGENGSEIVTTKDGLILTLNKGDGVIPHDMTENLMRMAQGVLPNISVSGLQLPNLDSRFGETNIEQHYDSLIHIDGSADAATVEDIKRMTNDLLDKSYKYTSQKIHEGYIKSGGRRAV